VDARAPERRAVAQCDATEGRTMNEDDLNWLEYQIRITELKIKMWRGVQLIAGAFLVMLLILILMFLFFGKEW
jgi:hypothetical protein